MDKHERARQELDAILAGLMTEKHMKQSDKMIIGASIRSQDPDYLKKLSDKNKGYGKGTKRNQNAIEKMRKTRKEKGIVSVKNHSEESKSKISANRKGKGHLHTDEAKAKISATKRSKLCKVMTPAGIFNNIYEAADHFNCHPQTIHNRTNSKPNEYFYKKDLTD